MMKRGCTRQWTKRRADGWDVIRDRVCGIALWKKGVCEDGGRANREQGRRVPDVVVFKQ